MHIIHGEDHHTSRNNLRDIIEDFKKKNIEPHYINGESITRKDLETILKTETLFAQEVLILENLLSRIRSKEKTKCIELLKSYRGNKNIVLWERKEITKKPLEDLSILKPKIKKHKSPMIIFKFTGEISPSNKNASIKLFHEALTTASDTFIFAMLIRQISNLITAKSSPKLLKGAPWQRSQLHKQAERWTLEHLLNIHSRLLDIDYKIKTGRSQLDLIGQLDLLLLEL